MRTILALLAGASLAACGASDDSLVQSHGLSAQAEAWEDHMPSALLPGQDPFCTALIVRFVVNGRTGDLPADITPEAVALKKPKSAAWVIPVSSSETERSPIALAGVARGCRSAAFSEGDELDVLIRVRSGSAAENVETKVKLYYAS